MVNDTDVAVTEQHPWRVLPRHHAGDGSARASADAFQQFFERRPILVIQRASARTSAIAQRTAGVAEAALVASASAWVRAPSRAWWLFRA